MLQLDCGPIIQKIQSLTEQMWELDNEIEACEAQALLKPLPRYFTLQKEADRLLKRQRALQNEWNNAMNDLAICRSEGQEYRLQGEEI
ncbi:hypothetical protein KSF_046780 [Reticulibacter mediterranei]|uniref:Uncharacterized protein n=1 Tax=Reticulibacter mediterranei TaxID=2778369 RepID=A0A8J3N3W2_9CHLR|nr:hypothetical protein [Reticulibacter mediterranei]GHO94630.1 hypothetical protein KSF_046780 [Reticulibacter mediterranei]